MKLLFENWRRYLEEGVPGYVPAEKPILDITGKGSNELGDPYESGTDAWKIANKLVTPCTSSVDCAKKSRGEQDTKKDNWHAVNKMNIETHFDIADQILDKLWDRASAGEGEQALWDGRDPRGHVDVADMEEYFDEIRQEIHASSTVEEAQTAYHRLRFTIEYFKDVGVVSDDDYNKAWSARCQMTKCYEG